MKFHQWDWNDAPNWKDITSLVRGMTSPSFVHVDTESDQYCVAIVPENEDVKNAVAEYEKWKNR